MNYKESENYLYSLGNEVETMKLGLDKIRTLLRELGDPQNNFKKIQVAGTNGKGSVCAFLDSILGEADIRRGLYTSPHLISITERIKIDGVDISESEFARVATLVRDTSESLVARGDIETVPTYFEQVTAIGLVAFANAKVELALLETGLGGRYDAVTAVEAEVAIVTRIDLDHQEYLGDTIEKIAAEKVAIIREDSLIVIGEQADPAMSVITEQCSEVGVQPAFASSVTAEEIGGAGVAFFVREPRQIVFPPVRIGLAGKHQVENARASITAALELRKWFQISDQNIADGLAKARHPGRLERIGRFLLDGAHNPSGARALRAYLDGNVRGPIAMIFGAMKDKAVAEMAEILWPRADVLILTRAPNPRAFTPEDLVGFLPAGFDETEVMITSDARRAVDHAISETGGTVVVTGSLYLVGEVRNLLQNRSTI